MLQSLVVAVDLKKKKSNPDRVRFSTNAMLGVNFVMQNNVLF